MHNLPASVHDVVFPVSSITRVPGAVAVRAVMRLPFKAIRRGSSRLHRMPRSVANYE
jgi:hypothetical protein